MSDFLWWRDGVIYQIYPRSFADSNGDGIGDLPGTISRLDYLAELGVDAIWLSPIYPTPDKDFGYDVSDYVNIDPRFGTMADYDRLVAEAHKRGIRVVLDLVLNHTSDQHPWFQESKSGRDNLKADWYIWKDHIPNNWLSMFGGPAWTYAPERKQYYYHMFLPEQPDVNWRNPEVREAILNSVRFWLDRGTDGFRLDVFNVYFKDDLFRNNPVKLGLRPFDWQKHIYDCERPEMMPLLKELREILDSYDQRYAVGETFDATPDKAATYVGPDGLHAAFNFDFSFRPYSPAQFLEAILAWDQAAGTHAWPNYVLSNHDNPRSATRYALDEEDARAKVVLAMLLTMRGTPFLYYGEEIGMRDISLKRTEIMDPPGKRYWPLYKGRDGCRAPMQWNATANAGFSTVRPWLPVHPDFPSRNVDIQRSDPASIFNFVRRLISLRREYRALRRGAFVPLSPQPAGAMVYLRRDDEQTIWIALNFSARVVTVTLPERPQQMLFSSKDAALPSGERLDLLPYEVCIMMVG